MDYLLNNKEAGLAIQLHIMNCNMSCIQRLTTFAENNLGSLIVHQSASYAIQRLIQRNLNFRISIASYCKQFFRELAYNEYASRVMQCLVEFDSHFCSYILSIFKKDLSIYVRHFSSVFLIAVALKNAKTDSEKDIFTIKHPKYMEKMLAKKFFKRILISYIESCSSTSLVQMYNILKYIYRTPADYLRDRYSTLLLIAFLERGFKPLEYAFLDIFRADPISILEFDTFGYFVSQIGHKASMNGYRDMLGIILRSLSHSQMFSVCLSDGLYTAFSKAVELVSLHRNPESRNPL
jgi:hypothetical protein